MIGGHETTPTSSLSKEMPSMTSIFPFSRRCVGLSAMLCVVSAAAVLAGPASAEILPVQAWSTSSLATPTEFVPGDTGGKYVYDVRATNIGAKSTSGTTITITDILPKGLEVEGELEFKLRYLKPGNTEPEEIDFGREEVTLPGGSKVSGICVTAENQPEVVTVTCTIENHLYGSQDETSVIEPSEEIVLLIPVFTPGTIAEGKILKNHVEVQGGGAAAASVTSENETATLDSDGNPEPAPAGFSYYHATLSGLDGLPVGAAGSHPYQYITSYALNTDPAPPGSKASAIPAGGDPKNIGVALPPGLVGNPNAASRCRAQDFNAIHTIFHQTLGYTVNDCPDSSAVGFVTVQEFEGQSRVAPTPLFNLTPPTGMPAQFGFQYVGIPFYIDTKVRSGTDYGITSTLHNLNQARRINGATVVLWGTSADERHKPLRGGCLSPNPVQYRISFGDCASGLTPIRPFLRLPTSCDDPLSLPMSIDTWTNRGVFFSQSADYPPPSGCSLLQFEPSLEARPTTNIADSPSGLHADLGLPQNEESEERGTSDLRKAVVTLGQGLVLNPSGANGLAACSSAQAGVTSDPGRLPVTFTPDPAQCPDAAKIGTAEVDTPLLDHPLRGSVYVATPHDNPFDSLLAIYIAVDDPQTGVVIKLAGHVQADPQTGQLTTTFAENPQQPFNDFKLELSGGNSAALRTPSTCGTYSTTSVMTPWSAPESGPPKTPSDSWAIEQAPGGGSCPISQAELPNAPSFNAGTVAPIAGAYSPMVINLRREDGSQEFGSLTVTPPPGLLGKLAGISYCPQSDLDAAAAKTGNAEKAHPSCPAASEVGTVTVGAGSGPAPYYTTGKAYLTGPYKGAPLGLAIVTPATAGPYDLGTVVVRTALYVDPETARITAVSDPIPHILEGIPLDVRSVAVRIDRPNFTLNPTNCDPLAFAGQLLSILGQAHLLSDRFQVGECGALGFKPKLSLRLTGGIQRSGHPALRATLNYPKGAYANIAKASVALPHSEFLDQAHIGTICTRVQFTANQCPAASVYGHARAITPLLDQPLEGPVYLRSSDNPLPDLVADLHGQIHVALDGRIDSVHGGIRTTFESVPDAPVSKFVLSMQGGKKGLLVNSRNICKQTNRAVAKFDAQNGKIADFHPALKNSKCAKQSKHKKHHRS